MSFRVKHLLTCTTTSSTPTSRKGMKVRHHMLGEDLGKRRPFPLHVRTAGGLRSPLATKNIPEVNKDVLWMDSFTFVMKKARRGYGFTVAGTCPVTVSKVESDSPAERAGLAKDDCIVRLNGQNVSRSSVASVAKLVRRSSQQIVVDVQRPSPADFPAASLCAQHGGTPRPYQGKAVEEEEEGEGEDKENRPLCGRRLRAAAREVREEVREAREETSTDTCSMLDSSQQESIMCSTPNTSPRDIHGAPPHGSPHGQAGMCERRRLVRAARDTEATFSRQMLLGVQLYSRPLRHALLSTTQHATLFQNIEKLVAISECLVRSMVCGRSDYYSLGDRMPQTSGEDDVIGGIYQPKVEIMCRAYESYCDGLADALQLLDELCTVSEFQHFLKEQTLRCGQPTISVFLQRPLHHMTAMFHNLEAIMANTPNKHIDLEDLQQVTKALAGCSHRLMKIENETTTDASSLVSRSLEVSTLRSSCRYPNASIASVDAELVHLQGRLVLPRYLKNFQLALPNRHIIYSGELLLQMGSKRWVKLWVVLMSDLLLLTRPGPDGCLEVFQVPVLLQDIISCDLTVEAHPSKFVLTLQFNEPPMRFLTFAAPSIEQRSTWCNILSQRIQSRITLADNVV